MGTSAKLSIRQKRTIVRNLSLWTTVRHELLSSHTLIATCILGMLYLFTIALLINYRLLTLSIANKFSFSTIISLSASLFIGSFTSMRAETIPFIVLLLNAFFVGLNLVLLWKTFTGIAHQGKFHISVGGATLFSLVTAGCASCGLSLISVLGLSASVAALPFHGIELRYVSFFLLFASAFYMLRELHQAKYCRI